MPLFYPGTDDEEEGIQNPLQVQGATDGEVFEGVGANDEAPAPPVPLDLTASPPPYVCQEPEISFVFDDIAGDWEPYRMVFLPRPQRSAPTEPELRCSARPRASPVGQDAAYLAIAQGSKPKKDKKVAKNKTKGTDTAPRKRARYEDNDGETTERPAIKKPKVKDVVVASDDERRSFPFSS